MPATPEARHLLIPFAGRGSPACRAALDGLALPNLQALLARLAPAETDLAGADTLSPPHERALARALGLTAPDGRLPWAAHEAALAGLSNPNAGEGWARVTLCHGEVAVDEMVIDDPAVLAVGAAESDDLLAAARPFFEEDGIRLHSSTEPGHWLARCALFEGIASASLDRAIRQPVSAWSAGAQEERALRRLANEMQMLLYTQPANDERATRNAPAINCIWFSGTGVLPENAPLDRAAPTVDARLRAPALQDDGPGWAAAWQALDTGPIAELRAAAARGEPVALTLCGDRAAQRWEGPASRGLGAWLKGLLGRQRPSDVLLQL
ncbi:MAG: hypothetical protein QM805_05365 [Pseudomonas sp.]